MGRVKYRAKILKIEGDNVHFSIPTEVFARTIPDFEGFDLADPLTLKADFLDIEKIFYLGSKGRLKNQFAKLVPEDVKTIFDPMCGTALFLAEMAKQGKRIIANDYSTAPFYTARAMFLKNKPNEEEFKAFLKSVNEVEGYYFQNAKKLFPILAGRKHAQKFIDGYILRAREAKFGHYYLGVLSACLLNWFGSFGGPYRKWSFAEFKSKLGFYAKQLRSFEIEGTVTNLDALTMEIPSVDMIYFDPPYSEKLFKYITKFGKLNAILLQKDWDKKEVTQDQVQALAEKLAGHCKYLFVSTSPACPIKWKALFERTKRQASQKRFALTGSGAIAASLPSAQQNKRRMSEILWVSVRKSEGEEQEKAEIEKAKADPFSVYPDESGDYSYMMHTHARGRSVHADLRIQSLGKEFLVGWTLMIQREGAIKEPILSMGDLRKINADSTKYYKINLQTGEWAEREKKSTKPGTTVRVELVATRKSPEPKSWMTFEGVVKPGVLGATKEFPGVFVIVDRGKAEYLSQKPWLHEYFFDGKVLKKGRFFFRQLRAWKTKKSDDEPDQQEILGSEVLWNHIADLNSRAFAVLKGEGMTDEEIRQWIEPQLIEVMKEMGLPAESEVSVDDPMNRGLKEEDILKAFVIPPGKEEGLGPELGWLCINPDDQIPYVLSNRAIEQGFLPPPTISALPKHWRKHVKTEEEYWTVKDKPKAFEMRKVLVKRWKEEGILSKAQKGDRDPFGKSVEKEAPVEVLWVGSRRDEWEAIEKARHRHDTCMECSHKPVLEIIWANGHGHAWFCWPCFVKWLGKETNPWSGKGDDVDYVKLVKDGEAAKKFADNRNPNIKEQLAEYFASEEIKGAAKEFEVFLERLKSEKDSKPESVGVSKAAVTEFRFTYQFWKGPKVVREGPTRERFLLWIKTGEKYLIFKLNDNILEADETGGMIREDNWGNEEYRKTGYVKPGTPLNPTTDTPSFIRLLGSGKAIMLIDKPELKKIQFKGKKLKGVFLFKRAEDHWYVERTPAEPGGET